MRPVTFLTGASSGIGRALAPLLAGEGHALALVARRLDKLETLAARIEASGGRALPIACDVTDREAVRAAVARAEAELGPVTRLVANAGGGNLTDATRLEASQLEGYLAANVLGAVYCVEAVLPGMIARGDGQLVVTSSLAGYRGLPGGAAYSASKSAVTTYFESLRVDLRPHGVAVTVLCPGFVRTEMAETKAYDKPFLLEVDVAVRRMHRAIARRDRHYAFPRRLAWLAWLGRVLPAGLADRVLARQGRKALPAPK